MINFIPPEAKAAVKREYIVRAASVWALLLAAVATVITVLLVPTYVLLLGQLEALSKEIVRMDEGSGTEYTEARATLGKTQQLAVELNVPTVRPTPSEILREIQNVQLRTIAISGFSYLHDGTKVTTLTIEGIAATREALAEFSAALEKSPLFARAAVPVSELAEDHDLPFTLTLTLADVAAATP